MIQRSHRCPEGTKCEAGHTPRLIEVLGKRRFYVECSPCGSRWPQRDSRDEALAAFDPAHVAPIPKPAERPILTLHRRAK